MISKKVTNGARRLTRRAVLGKGMQLVGGLAAGAVLTALDSCLAAAQGGVVRYPPPRIGPDGCPQWGDTPIPVTGFIKDEALRGVDDLVIRSMRECNTPGVVVAVSQKGVVTLSRGYGYKDHKLQVPMPADAMMRVASVVKVIDGTAMRLMIKKGFSFPTPTGAVPLKLDTRVFPLFAAKGIRPPRGSAEDPRLSRITVEHLLKHTAGLPGAPSGWTLARDLNLSLAPTGEDILRWLMCHPLQFNPGEKSSYSNEAYTVLHHLMHAAALAKYRDGYYEFLRKEVLGPAGSMDLVRSPGRPSQRHPRDVTYWSADQGRPCYLSSADRIPLCDGADDFDIDAYLPWAITAPALCQYLSFWLWDEGVELIDAKKGGLAKGVNNGIGVFGGAMPGTLSSILQARWSLTNCAVITNRGTEHMKVKWDLPDRINKRILLPYQGLPAEQ